MLAEIKHLQVLHWNSKKWADQTMTNFKSCNTSLSDATNDVMGAKYVFNINMF